MSYVDMARSHVKELAREAFELDEVVVDEDGDLPFPFGSVMLFVSVTHGGRLVRAWSRAVSGVRATRAVLSEVNDANVEAVLARVCEHDGNVWVEGYLPVQDLAADDLGRLVCEVGRTADRIGSMLAAVHGGTVCFPGGCAAAHDRE